MIVIDHPGWVALQQHFARHIEGYLESLSLLFIATICMMPENRPKTIDDWWKWFRNSLQTAIPAARVNSHAAPPQQQQNSETQVDQEKGKTTP